MLALHLSRFHIIREPVQQRNSVKIRIENIHTSPTVLVLTEDVRELNALLSQEPGQEGYAFEDPPDIELVHYRSDNDLFLSGTIRGRLTGQCARCLENYSFAFDRPFSIVLSPEAPFGKEVELGQDELSAGFYSGESIDVSALVHEQIFLALPSVPLCNEECKGLCAQCGNNLNHETCGCQPAWTDPRLAILSSLRASSSGVLK